MTRAIVTVCLLAVLTVPLSGCIPMAIGYLVAKSMETPKIVTTTCDKPADGTPQACTTVSK